MGRPILEGDVFAAEKQLLTGTVGHQSRHDVDDFDAVFLRRRQTATVRIGDAVAAHLGMSRQVEEGVDTSADALASLKDANFEPAFFERYRRFESRETGTDDDDIRIATAGSPRRVGQARDCRGGSRGGDELASVQ